MTSILKSGSESVRLRSLSSCYQQEVDFPEMQSLPFKLQFSSFTFIETSDGLDLYIMLYFQWSIYLTISSFFLSFVSFIGLIKFSFSAFVLLPEQSYASYFPSPVVTLKVNPLDFGT